MSECCLRACEVLRSKPAFSVVVGVALLDLIITGVHSVVILNVVIISLFEDREMHK